jgi:hypothetical protein
MLDLQFHVFVVNLEHGMLSQLSLSRVSEVANNSIPDCIHSPSARW